MAAVDVMDETFLVVERPVLAAWFAGAPARGELWPDLALTVFTDRGEAGIRWSVHGAWTGSAEVWLEEVGDGVVVHQFLRLDPAGPGPAAVAGGRAAVRESLRRQKQAKALALGLKARLEGGRAPGEPRRATAGPGPR